MKVKFQPNNINFAFESSILFYFFGVFILYQVPEKFEPWVRSGIVPPLQNFTGITFLPACFVILNLICYLILRSYLILRLGIMIVSGIAMAVIKFYLAPGIIDPVYFFIISTVCAAIIAIYKGSYLDEQLREIKTYDEVSQKLVEYIRDGYKYFLGKAFQGWLGLGASLGVSMSILFKGGYEDPHLKFMALKMLLGFIFITIAIVIWVGIPMLNGVATINDTLHQFNNHKNASRPPSSISGPCD